MNTMLNTRLSIVASFEHTRWNTNSLKLVLFIVAAAGHFSSNSESYMATFAWKWFESDEAVWAVSSAKQTLT